MLNRRHINPYLGATLLGEKEISLVSEIISSKHLFRYYGYNSYCEKVEKKIISDLNINYAHILTNGTIAIKAALMSLRPNIGDIILVPALTYIATINACLSAGLIPKLIEVDDSGHMCTKALSDYLTHNEPPKAIIVVHLDGSSADIINIANLASQYHIQLIEDVAQSYGVTRNHKYLGTFGSIGCFSFQENKTLSIGEGGAIVTSDLNLFNNMIAFCDHGALRNSDYHQCWDKNHGFGENAKVTELSGGLLSLQLAYLPTIRKTLAKNYFELVESYLRFNVIKRQSEDTHLSVWVQGEKILDELHTSNITFYNWSHMYMPEHPIIKYKRTLYADNFPWNLDKNPQIFDGQFDNAKKIAMQRFSIPVNLEI